MVAHRSGVLMALLVAIVMVASSAVVIGGLPTATHGTSSVPTVAGSAVVTSAPTTSSSETSYTVTAAGAIADTNPANGVQLGVSQSRAQLVTAARNAFTANGVSLNNFLPPNLNSAPPVAQTENHIVPLYEYQAAPLGISTFGLMNTSGRITPYIAQTTSLEGTFTTTDPLGVQVSSPYFSGLNSYGAQLNTVMNRTTLFGSIHDPQGLPYSFWLQNVINYNPTAATNQLSFENNIWNFTNPSGDFPSNTILHGIGRVVSGEVYEESGPSMTITYPFTLDLYLNTTVGSYLGSLLVNEVYFNYTVFNSAGAHVCPTTEPSGETCSLTIGGMYDNVYFNSAAPVSPVNVVFGSAEMEANGFNYNGLGLPNDMEMDWGIGTSSGANANINYADASVGLYLWNATAHQYERPISAYNFGSETGETTTGAYGTYTITNGVPSEQFRTGPGLLGGLWNATGVPSATTAGAFALNTANIVPGNAFVAIAAGAGVTNQSYFQVAPTIGWFSGKGTIGKNLWLQPGVYTLEVMLSGYTMATQNVVLLSSSSTPSITLARQPIPTVYTPLWAFTNSDLANLSLSGSGTLGSPYIMPSNQPGTLAPVFAILNDYLFIVWTGIWINATTAYVDFNPAPSLNIVYPSWWLFQIEDLAAAYGPTPLQQQLPIYLLHSQNVTIANAAGIGGWSSNIEVGNNYNVYVNLGKNDLFYKDFFNVSSEGLEFLGGTAGVNQNNYVWGSTFAPYSNPAYVGMSAVSTAMTVTETGTHIYNNEFFTNSSRGLTVSSGSTQTNFWNATGGYQPATNSISVNGFALTGSILGQNIQGGNFWFNYGQHANPYGIPYVDRETSPTGTAEIGKGGDFAPLTIYTPVALGATVPSALGAGLYHVVFTESGLTGSTSWTVYVHNVPTYNPRTAATTLMTIANTTTASVSTTLGFWIPNGTYSFTLASVTGFTQTTPPLGGGPFTVSGAAVTMPTLVFSASSTTYAVTFPESGLATGVSWSVTIGATTTTVTAPASVVFQVVAGTYSYSIPAVAGYSANPTSGMVTVVSSPLTVSATVFSHLYSVTFHESGLPGETSWSVTLGTTMMSTSSTIVFELVNGAYDYSIGGVPGYHQTTLPYNGGSVTVSGGAIVEPTLAFTTATYAVTFSQTGLPPRTSWSVTSGSTVSSTSGSLVLQLSNGTHDFSIGSVAGYHQTTLPYTGGWVVVSGGAVVEPTLAFSPTTYWVTFAETGLRPGLSWTMTLGSSTLGAVAPGTITFTGVVNGTYTFRSGTVMGYTAVPLSGSIHVSGASPTQVIRYAVRPLGPVLGDLLSPSVIAAEVPRAMGSAARRG